MKEERTTSTSKHGFNESRMPATYIVGGKGRVRILPVGSSHPSQATMVEDFVASSLAGEGRVVVRCEGQPFANIFGSVMFPWLEEHWPAELRMREAPPQGEALESYLAGLPETTRELRHLFREQLAPSLETRSHLYTPAMDSHVEAADLLIRVMSPRQVMATLRYLAEDYWYRRAGWPDLATFRLTEDGPADLELVEVKSHRDQLGKDQRAWIAANEASLDLPFRVIRVERAAEAPKPESLKWPYQPPRSVWVPAGHEAHPAVAPLIEAERAETAWLLSELEARRRRHAEIQEAGGSSVSGTGDPCLDTR